MNISDFSGTYKGPQKSWTRSVNLFFRIERMVFGYI